MRAAVKEGRRSCQTTNLEPWAQHDYYYPRKTGKPPTGRPPYLGIMFFSAPHFNPAVGNDIKDLRSKLIELRSGTAGDAYAQYRTKPLEFDVLLWPRPIFCTQTVSGG